MKLTWKDRLEAKTEGLWFWVLLLAFGFLLGFWAGL